MTSRRLFALLLAGYLLFLAGILLNPSVAAPGVAVQHLGSFLQRLGAPTTLVTGSRVEFLLNAAMFARSLTR